MSALGNLAKVGVFPRQMKEAVAAYYLSYSVEKFRQMYSDPSSGMPVPRREGRSIFWLKDDLDRWLDHRFGLSPPSHANDDEDRFEEFKARLAHPSP